MTYAQRFDIDPNSESILLSCQNADRDGFTADEIQHAWHKHGVNGAHGYLQSNWTEYIARAYSNLEDRPDRLPQIRQLLIENSGNVKEVVRKARKFDKDLVNTF